MQLLGPNSKSDAKNEHAWWPGRYFKRFSLQNNRECYFLRQIQDVSRLFRRSCFSYRILGKVLTSEAGNHIEVRGRLIRLAENLGVIIAEASVSDAEVRSDEIRKLDKNIARNVESSAASHLPPDLGRPHVAPELFFLLSPFLLSDPSLSEVFLWSLEANRPR